MSSYFLIGGHSVIGISHLPRFNRDWIRVIKCTKHETNSKPKNILNRLSVCKVKTIVKNVYFVCGVVKITIHNKFNPQNTKTGEK